MIDFGGCIIEGICHEHHIPTIFAKIFLRFLSRYFGIQHNMEMMMCVPSFRIDFLNC